jgi:hypothetical protein
LSFSLSSITWKALIESIPEKTVDLDNMARVSSMLPMGALEIELISFKALKSTHQRMVPPFFGAAKVPRAAGLLDHAVLQPLVNLFLSVPFKVGINWTKPLVDGALIGLSHNTCDSSRGLGHGEGERKGGGRGRL